MARDEGGQALNRAHRRRFLLSGLLVCGMCGGGYTIMGKDRYGCAAHRSKGTCGNDRTIARQAIESRVLDGLKHHLLAPELFEAFARSYQEECAVLARSVMADRAGLEGRLAAVERKIAAMIRAIEDGLYQPAMKERMAALEAEKSAAGDGAGAEAGRDADRPASQPAAALPQEGRGAGGGAGRPRARARGHGGDPRDDHADRADAQARRAAWRRCWRAISRGS